MHLLLPHRQICEQQIYYKSDRPKKILSSKDGRFLFFSLSKPSNTHKSTHFISIQLQAMP